ncbi:hypothetical protein CEV31_1820 [Brucella thiophenivorans]|uniref:Uncharacterized protein n=1 Tax=Brucella thiophenivorans TaxID=571255 RepID=A0A256FXQ1_9HYPH|nr:hypothetical protein CEV31_1820 [Brucella thiophenivorans]
MFHLQAKSQPDPRLTALVNFLRFQRPYPSASPSFHTKPRKHIASGVL